eukprot:CAMPEP_0203754858 /NCGR_PEP_ID=MMETSP0098-20131031/8411_1 /ASSEMBLY_ACC=CAM_ASM_000208 /TAXON_ID=96639 /ORGANISM=" , Strain NY0313808BC1" /LENGTH=1016 /DNA_ID=CAMNT_0050646083 /DNA_START=192 /DNA_END=3239 /DNA_ORIENTATION=-
MKGYTLFGWVLVVLLLDSCAVSNVSSKQVCDRSDWFGEIVGAGERPPAQEHQSGSEDTGAVATSEEERQVVVVVQDVKLSSGSKDGPLDLGAEALVEKEDRGSLTEEEKGDFEFVSNNGDEGKDSTVKPEKESKPLENTKSGDGTVVDKKNREKLVVISPDEFKKKVLGSGEVVVPKDLVDDVTNEVNVGEATKAGTLLDDEKSTVDDVAVTKENGETETGPRVDDDTVQTNTGKAKAETKTDKTKDEAKTGKKKTEKVKTDKEAALDETVDSPEEQLERKEEEDLLVREHEQEQEIKDAIESVTGDDISAETTTETPEVHQQELDQQFNYASLDAGAIILGSTKAMKHSSSLLVDDRDKYALTPCGEEHIWVTISLSEEVEPDTIVIANFERYSSTVKKFEVLGGDSQSPVQNWNVLGVYEAKPGLGEQVFKIQNKAWVRYLKFRFLTHYGDEFYCTLSEIRVYGSTDKFQAIHRDLDRQSTEAERVKETIEKAFVHSVSDDDEGQTVTLVIENKQEEPVAQEIVVVDPSEETEKNPQTTSTDSEVTNVDPTAPGSTTGEEENPPPKEENNGTPIVPGEVQPEKDLVEDVKETQPLVQPDEKLEKVGENKPADEGVSEELEKGENEASTTKDTATEDGTSTVEYENSATLFASEYGNSEMAAIELVSTENSRCLADWVLLSEQSFQDVEGKDVFFCVRYEPRAKITSPSVVDQILALNINREGKKWRTCPSAFQNLATLAVKGEEGVILCVRYDTVATQKPKLLGKLILHHTSFTGKDCVFTLRFPFGLCTNNTKDTPVENDEAKVEHKNIEAKSQQELENEANPELAQKTEGDGTKTVASGSSLERKDPSPSGPPVQQPPPRGPTVNAKNSMESVFKVLTDKILRIEVDQSLFKKYLEDYNTKYSTVIGGLHKEQDDLEARVEKLATLLSTLETSKKATRREMTSSMDQLERDNKELRMQFEELQVHAEEVRLRSIVLENQIADVLLVCFISLAFSLSVLLLCCVKFCYKEKTQ